jgi:hypothetical protein
MAGLLDAGYTIYTDSWYTSPALFADLQDRHTNRRNMPHDFETSKRPKGDLQIRSNNKGQLAVVWQDKRPVRLLSTVNVGRMVDTNKRDIQGNRISKPDAVLQYNRGKGGVDASDQLAATYGPKRKTVKWYRKTAFNMLHMCAVNAHRLHRYLGGKLELVDFLLKIIDETFTAVKPKLRYSGRGRPGPAPGPGRLAVRDRGHWPAKIPNKPEGKKVWRRCVVCHKAGREKRTNAWCPEDSCRAALCATPCFGIYHTVP